MSDKSNPKHECKCDGGKEIKALKKQIADLTAKYQQICKEIITLRKAVHR